MYVLVDGPLAQSVERRADNAKVVSSRLTWTTSLFFFSLSHSWFIISFSLFFPYLTFFFLVTFNNIIISFSTFLSIQQDNRDQAVDEVSH